MEAIQGLGVAAFKACSMQVPQYAPIKLIAPLRKYVSEILNMRDGKITQEELEIAKAKYNGSFALGMEDPARTATYASNILINNLPKDFYRTLFAKNKSVYHC